MRLDAYLVKTGSFSSRDRAKRAITDGQVKINGIVVTKTSRDIAYSDTIEIADGLDKPAGYWKLKMIQERTNLLKPQDRVLDIGSSAGGFLMFASGIAKSVHGIEFSREFYPVLKKLESGRSNVTLEFSDVFTMPFESEKYDVLLLDITVSPLSSIKALKNALPALKKGGLLLQVLKMPKDRDREPILKLLSLMGLEIIDMLEPEKEEVYIITKKMT
jgi:23S rRNA (cytidine1920-2'-O)/16S rRNA (cytidine1409-2'-O)-methyltransferase